MLGKIVHKDLVKKAKLWLISAKNCNPVFTEQGSAINNEFPDAVGWASSDCIVVECKASLSDFHIDKQKVHRNNNLGMGKYRFYLIPQTIVEQVKNNLLDGWGLVVLYNEEGYPRQERLMNSSEFQSNIEAERNYLRSRILEIQRFGRI